MIDQEFYIAATVYEALSNAVDNGYPHEYGRRTIDYVLEIQDYSGIEYFNDQNPKHLVVACAVVTKWRKDHPEKE